MSSSSSSAPNEPPADRNPNEENSSNSWAPSWWVAPAVLKERFWEFDDGQRIERLSECRKLDKILKDCRKRQNNNNKKKHPKEDPIESLSIGLRNMKYFEWRGILKHTTTTSEENEDNSNNNSHQHHHDAIRSSCAREEHAVWACRAIATGCGRDLGALKKCFGDEGSLRVLTAPHTHYRGGLLGDDNEASTRLKEAIPCSELQRTLGSCVTERGQALLQRKQQRDQQPSQG